MKKLHLSRRQALSLLGVGGASAALIDPVNMLISGLVDGIISKAQADAKTVVPRNFVYIGLPGAPARWGFDLPLFPYSGDHKNVHPFINTRFKEAPGQTIPEYVTAPITRNGVTLHMPYLWSTDIPTLDGKKVPMGDLMENLMILRGIDMKVDGHLANARKNLRPLAAAPSLTGSVADLSPTPIPAVAFGRYVSFDSYKSRRGVGQVIMTGPGNPLNTILSAFNTSGDALNSAYVTRRKAMSAAIDSALASLGEYANSGTPGADALFAYRHRAEELLRKGVGNLETAYEPVRKKYQDLSNRVAHWGNDPLPGFYHQALPFDGMPGMDPSKVCVANRECWVRNPDLRTLIQQNAYVANLAEGFAVAEYLLLSGYSSAVTLGLFGTANGNFENRVSTSTGLPLGTVNNQGIEFDEHFCGVLVSTIQNSFTFRAIATCLYEFIRTLKGAGLFDETVIQLGSEFSRNPKDNMGGSDHGWTANTTSLFCGAIKSPMVLGNTHNHTSFLLTETKSAWGHGAEVELEGQRRVLNVGNSSSTVAQLLRVERPMKNDSPLITETNGTVYPNIELAREIS